ncbi:MAG: sigma-70 family RNA polymerase sigma factor [Defluviitaleaceae bacterium]|nr:sigma-70 family RNA polymerase sigma factor [Defluviitaleaceae bacterium]MCL2240129.1 sigma-70 family RNA polymerase sigma factor [Defluviitaleaceae bacterium]
MPEKDLRTDMELIESCLAGNQDDFTELVNRYKNLVYSIILRQTRDTEEANDYAQDVFLKVYRNLRSYTPAFKFSTWVMRITGNHIIDQHRKKKAETVPFEPHMAEGAGQPREASPETQYLQREQAERVQKIVADLPEMYRVPVVLYHQQDMSYQEIAEVIGEPLSKVKNRIFRGRKLLKEMLTARP